MGVRGHAQMPMAVLRAWRAITWRRWAWTTAIALVLFVVHAVGVLPAVLYAPSVTSSPRVGWAVAKSTGMALMYVGAAYCLLLSVSVAEWGFQRRLPPLRRYFAAGLAACGAAIVFEVALFTLVPSISAQPTRPPILFDPQELRHWVVWSAANFALIGGLVLAVYVRFRSARIAREAFNAAELERVAASREVLASRLTAMQARVEPRFLLGTLAQVEALYQRDPPAGDRMLDALIAYLHAALPQLRSAHSTLQQEMQLAESYLRIMQIRMGSRLELRFDLGPAPADCDFPPMVVLPLIDEALRNGLEPLPHGGAIAVSAGVEGERVRVRISDNGLPRSTVASECDIIATLHERVRGLYGGSASLHIVADAPQGVVATIEVPLEAPRADR